jgi:hypothetical protein
MHHVKDISIIVSAHTELLQQGTADSKENIKHVTQFIISLLNPRSYYENQCIGSGTISFHAWVHHIFIKNLFQLKAFLSMCYLYSCYHRIVNAADLGPPELRCFHGP